MKKYILALAAILPSLVPVYAQQTKTLTADKHNEYGLVYTLPQTVLEIEVTARRTVKKVGPFYQYSKKFIGTDNVITEDSESWDITDVRVRPYGVADPSQKYLMQLKPGAVSYICVDDNGMLLAINRDVPAPATPVYSPAASPDASAADKRNINDYLKYVNEDFIASQSSLKRAQMLAENLMEVRESKVALTRGKAETMPTDGKQMELMLASLGRQEEALTAAFTGYTETETETRTYTFTPIDEGKSTLFRLSDFAGFVPADDYSGDPVYVAVQITQRGALPVDPKGEVKKLPKDAVIYNIPGAAAISVIANGETLWNGEMEIAQFGVRFGLDPKLFTAKKGRMGATFNAITGGVTDITEVTQQ